MIFFEATLVRMKETKEPVAIFEQTDDIVDLGKRIDEIVDPSLCEYADDFIEVDFSILFPSSARDQECENEEGIFGGIISEGHIDDVFSKQILDYFSDLGDNAWVDFPNQFSFLTTEQDFEDRFWESSCGTMKEKDLF